MTRCVVCGDLLSLTMMPVSRRHFCKDLSIAGSFKFSANTTQDSVNLCGRGYRRNLQQEKVFVLSDILSKRLYLGEVIPTC